MITFNTEPIVSYLGTDNLSKYSFPFRVERDADLKVYVIEEADKTKVTELVLNDDYTYKKLPFPKQGGEITLVDLDQSYLDNGFLASTYRLYIEFVAQPDQLTPFRAIDAQTPAMLERAVDRMAMNEIAMNAQLHRSVKLSVSDRNKGYNVELPQLEGNEHKILTINEDGNGFDVGPTVEGVQAMVDTASLARDEAVQARDEAVIAKGDSEAAQTAAEEARDEAVTAKEDAEGFRDETEEIRAEAEFYANLFMFDNIVTVNDGMSPFTIDAGNNSTLYMCVDEDDDIDINLPSTTSVSYLWHIATIKKTDSANVIRLVPAAGQTVNGQTALLQAEKGVGASIYRDADDENNWKVKYFAFTDSGGAGGTLPAGGDEGAALVKVSDVDNEAQWDNFEFEGYSARFATQWYSKGLRDTLAKILNISYLGPLIASFTGSSNILREKGASVSSITLTANVTKRSNPIGRIVFSRGGTIIADFDPPANTGSGTTSTLYNTPFADNTTFTVQVTDTVSADGGPTSVSANVTYSFVYPYYYGAGAPGRTPAQVAAMSKDIISSAATLNRSFTTNFGDVYYFAYPSSYGNLTSILDENGFEVMGSFTKREETITGLDSNAVNYNIYESVNPVIAGTTNFTFKR